MSFNRSVGLDKKIIELFGHPKLLRNTRKSILGRRFGFVTSTLKSSILLLHVLHLPLRLSWRDENNTILRPNMAILRLRGAFLPAHVEPSIIDNR